MRPHRFDAAAQVRGEGLSFGHAHGHQLGQRFVQPRPQYLLYDRAIQLCGLDAKELGQLRQQHPLDPHVELL